MKPGRQNAILEIISEKDIETQNQLMQELAARGVKSTQATLSRDIKDMRLVKELGPSGIRVNCVAPGVIRTDMLDALPPEVLPQLAQETPLGRLGTPEDIAHAVAFLAGDGASFITGQVLTCDGGFIL